MLCESCESLELNYGSFTMGNHRRPEHVPLPSRWWLAQGRKQLGSLRRILRRSAICPLCRLIVRSLALQKDDFWVNIGSEPYLDAETKLAPIKLADLDAECEACWQVDGRIKLRDGEGDVVEVPCTRRLCIRWHQDHFPETHLVLIVPNVSFGPRKLFLGRLLTSLEDSKLKQIQNWFSLCLGSHGSSCAIDPTNEQFTWLRRESYFGVVDVKKMQLTALPAKASYAALSYTWGSDQQEVGSRFTATIQNVDALKEVNGVRNIEKELPRTIRDAIDLVRSLGIRYLWVDSLCILQGDADHWALIAGQMDTVYGNASLTICAADGGDAHCGLKALHPLDSRHDHHAKQLVEMVKPDMQLMATCPPETYISRSVWNTRAWTFQERVLSKRCLIFVEGRVYYQCRSSTMSEDIHAEEPEAGWSIESLHGPLQKFNNLDHHPVDLYKYSVHLYTSRFLTKDDDILAAFSGIGKEICSRLGGEPIFGLPNTHFDLAMIWKPDNAPSRRRKSGKLAFPSWSWCGWKDSKMSYMPTFVEGCELNLHEWLMNHTWITWYIRDGHGNLRLIWDPKLYCTNSGHLLSRWQGYCSHDVNHSHSRKQDDETAPVIDHYQRHLTPSLQKLKRDSFERTMPKYPYQVRMVEPGRRSTRPEERLEDQRFLQFWTWSAYFYLVPEDPQQPFSKRPKQAGSNLVRFGIQDGDYNLVGTITLGAEWETTSNLETKHEFIAISDAKGFTVEEMREWSFVEPSLPGQAEWYAYNVLLLTYDDEIRGVARRAGLGKIYKRAFETACSMPDRKKRKEWKELILG